MILIYSAKPALFVYTLLAKSRYIFYGVKIINILRSSIYSSGCV